jgi:hypothetical protein
MRFKEYNEYAGDKFKGEPQRKCYKCGNTVPVSEATYDYYHLGGRDANRILHINYICKACKIKMTRAKLIREEENDA